MNRHKLSDQDTQIIREFEQDYDARVHLKGHKIKSHMMPAFYHAEAKPTEPAIETEPAYQVEIGESDLIKLTRTLRDQEWHTHVQHRHPHLREAYMNYLTQVYLTVDYVKPY